MSEKIAVHWFRQDLRIKDNPSLEAASKCDSFIPIYILDDTNSGEFKMGSASRWWLYHSLNKLNESFLRLQQHTYIPNISLNLFIYTRIIIWEFPPSTHLSNIHSNA